MKTIFMLLRGGREANKQLLSYKFDYIFFTGSKVVGKVVMEAAAKNLTPITLELGGKSPCIVDESANLDLAAKKIAWGKLINAGQTCVAPDYLLVTNKIKKPLIEKLIFYFKQYQNLPTIINEKHFLRLSKLIETETVIYGGTKHKKTLQFNPTIIAGKLNTPIMDEEIFGPILPIIEIENIDEAIKFINKLPKPLALYLFTTSKVNEEKVIHSLSFGGGCINDTIIHLASNYLPFGGIGESGFGSYHGKASFDTFSHYKSILKKGNIDFKYRYLKSTKIIRKFLK